MHIDIATGLLREARWCESPNQDTRPDAEDIELLVIHSISLPPGEYGGPHIEALFMNRLDTRAHPYFEEIAHLRVSAHLLIRRDGELVQFVPFHCRAWHAGDSCYAERRDCNDFSIGVELEGVDDCGYAAVQYTALARVVGALLNTYPRLDARRIVGHCDIAPQRKTDPGPAFDWRKLEQLLLE